MWGRAGVWHRNLVFGLGVGPCAYFDTHGDANGAFHDEHGLAALFSGTATFPVRASGSWIITQHDRDTDVFLAGLSYRF